MARQYYRNYCAVDLFCGCGGLTLGLEEAGFNIVGAVELDPVIARTYSTNHPNVRMWNQDIRSLCTMNVLNELKLQKGDLSLLAGCPPCQGFSQMRTKHGSHDVEDKRNSLINEFLRFIRDLLPKAIMLENVPTLAENVVFDKFIKEINSLGYKGSPRVLDVSQYGVPQRRKRLILMAGYGFDIPYAVPSHKIKTVREAIGAMPIAGHSGDILHDMLSVHSEHVMDIIRHVPHDGGSRKDLPDSYTLACHKHFDGFQDVYGRMSWDKVAPTITSGCCNPSKGRFLHPIEDRAITMREAALLQGFPINYKFCGQNKGKITLMIGNALPPPFIKAHALEIMKMLG